MLPCDYSRFFFFFTFCPLRCLIVLFSGSSEALCHLVGEEGAGCFSLVCGLCTVCHGVFALPLGVIGRLFL